MMKSIIAAFAALAVSVTMFSAPVRADYYSDGITLYQGMNNAEVTNLQNDLKQLGYFNYSATGYFGTLTKDAVIAFQKANGLYADGVAGKQTAREIKVDTVLKTARQYTGVPYVWGGTSPSGFDCSGFTHYVFLKNDIILPRTAALQYNQGTWVSKASLQPGDLVFFTTYAPGPSHVGIYLGDGQFIHASSGAGKITVSSLSNPYYQQRYIGAKRIIK